MGTLMSFRWVVDSARVASCLIKVSFCGVVDSAPQASFREVVDSACGNAREHIMNYTHSVSWLTIFSFLPVTSATSLLQQARVEVPPNRWLEFMARDQADCSAAEKQAPRQVPKPSPVDDSVSASPYPAWLLVANSL